MRNTIKRTRAQSHLPKKTLKQSSKQPSRQLFKQQQNIRKRRKTRKTNNHNTKIRNHKIYKSAQQNISRIQKEVIMHKNYKNNRSLDPTHNTKLRNGRCQCVKYETIVNDEGVETVEMHKCTDMVKPGTDFCAKHQGCMSFLRQFVNGYEPAYKPNDWAHPYIEGSHNCYAYFLDDRKDSIKVKCEEICLKNNKRGCPKKDSGCRDLIPQPGDHFLMSQYGNLDKKTRNYSCPNMHSRIISDNPDIKPSRLTQKCPARHYKGAMVVDPDHTFHFYRQNPDGTWSHKPGVLPVTNKDASGNTIYIPHFADRDYTQGKKGGDIKYDDFCGYYCIPHDQYIQTSLI